MRQMRQMRNRGSNRIHQLKELEFAVVPPPKIASELTVDGLVDTDGVLRVIGPDANGTHGMESSWHGKP